jgi:hypothetical protein
MVNKAQPERLQPSRRVHSRNAIIRPTSAAVAQVTAKMKRSPMSFVL